MAGRRTVSINNAIYGTDISGYQFNIDWDKMLADGMKFVIIKASEESHGAKMFNQHRIDAGNAGLKVGFYHFFTTDIGSDGKNQEAEALAQANYLLGKVLPMKANEKWLALDFERFNGNEKLPSPPEADKARVRKLGEIFVTRLHEATGQWPLIYVSPGTANKFDLGKSSILTQCPLWVAHWGPKFQPQLPRGWKSWYMWQCGGDLPAGTIPAIPQKVDVNVLNPTVLVKSNARSNVGIFATIAVLALATVGAYAIYKTVKK